VKCAGGGIRTHEGLRHRVSQVLADTFRDHLSLAPPDFELVRSCPLDLVPAWLSSARQRLGYPRMSARDLLIRGILDLGQRCRIGPQRSILLMSGMEEGSGGGRIVNLSATSYSSLRKSFRRLCGQCLQSESWAGPMASPRS